jgi:hypothetical protein
VGQSEKKLAYLLAGFISGLSLFIEKKGRRMELTLYVMARAIDSFFVMMRGKGWIFTIPNGEVAIFMLSTAVVMYAFEKEPEALKPLYLRFLKYYIGKN